VLYCIYLNYTHIENYLVRNQAGAPPELSCTYIPSRRMSIFALNYFPSRIIYHTIQPQCFIKLLLITLWEISQLTNKAITIVIFPYIIFSLKILSKCQ
jgi:hypothetical protein